jgi:hypothetical protein
MREIRARHSELTETKGGCALWNKRGWVASLGACSAGTCSSAGAYGSAGAATPRERPYLARGEKNKGGHDVTVATA